MLWRIIALLHNSHCKSNLTSPLCSRVKRFTCSCAHPINFRHLLPDINVRSITDRFAKQKSPSSLFNQTPICFRPFRGASDQKASDKAFRNCVNQASKQTQFLSAIPVMAAFSFAQKTPSEDPFPPHRFFMCSGTVPAGRDKGRFQPFFFGESISAVS